VEEEISWPIPDSSDEVSYSLGNAFLACLSVGNKLRDWKRIGIVLFWDCWSRLVLKQASISLDEWCYETWFRLVTHQLSLSDRSAL
jgi:hypothetical protein